jgi:hypothetical protein
VQCVTNGFLWGLMSQKAREVADAKAEPVPARA